MRAFVSGNSGLVLAKGSEPWVELLSDIVDRSLCEDPASFDDCAALAWRWQCDEGAGVGVGVVVGPLFRL